MGSRWRAHSITRKCAFPTNQNSLTLFDIKSCQCYSVLLTDNLWWNVNIVNIRCSLWVSVQDGPAYVCCLGITVFLLLVFPCAPELSQFGDKIYSDLSDICSISTNLKKHLLKKRSNSCLIWGLSKENRFLLSILWDSGRSLWLTIEVVIN